MKTAVAAVGIVLGWHAAAAAQPRILTVDDIKNWDSPIADVRIPYGDGEFQFGDLRLPEGTGPHPVAILIHGGCFLSMYDIAHNARFAEALAESGMAVWNLEYRRVGNDGGGWPGTFEDIAHGADHLRVLAKEYPLDLERTISIGHSAGGHLALWVAARHRLADDSPIRFGDPISLKGVLALASVPDLAYLHEKRPCEGAVDGLVGGSPEEVPAHYAQASLVELVPLGLPQILINGKYDYDWAPIGVRYFEAAKAVGDDVRLIEAPESGHFELIDPASSTWPIVRDAALELLGSGSASER